MTVCMCATMCMFVCACDHTILMCMFVCAYYTYVYVCVCILMCMFVCACYTVWL